MKEDRLLDMLLYAVNEANGWYDDSGGRGINTPEMRQCVAVLAAHGRSPEDYNQGRIWKDKEADGSYVPLTMSQIIDAALKHIETAIKQPFPVMEDSVSKTTFRLPSGYRDTHGKHDN